MKQDAGLVQRPLGKFEDADWTAAGEPRARVAFRGLRTLWFNTGTLCNITCANCYILSSPTNDALVYLTAAEVTAYLDEIAVTGLPTTEIGFTGGEPFLNPEILAMLEAALERGFAVLVLTNAMRPMMRPSIRAGLARLTKAHGKRLVLRVSLDHHTAALHDAERGEGSFAQALSGMRWLAQSGIATTIAGRAKWGEAEAEARAGYAALLEREELAVDAADPAALVLFPEMDENAAVPEISERCWGVLGRSPADMMCASSRMVVRRRGAPGPVVLACTLLAYDAAFELGATLAEAARPVPLNHPHCARFCVLGGARCSG